VAKKPELFSFAEPTARKLGKFAHSLPDAERPPQVILEERTFCRLFQAPEGGISARIIGGAGTVIGEAECHIVSVAEFGGLIVTDKTFVVFNWTKQVVCATGDRYGTADRDGFGTWWVNAADCSDTG